MKLRSPDNSNYAAVVVKIESISKLENSDNIVSVPLIGYQAIVSKDVKIGDIGIVFPAETQLSYEYTYENNLHAHGNLNKDNSVKGYLGDKRRVRAIKLRGNRSDCLFMPLSSLKYTKAKIYELKVGDTFDEINGHKICNKYTVKSKTPVTRLEKNKLKFTRIDKKFMPEHYDSDQYARNAYTIPEDKQVIVTQKLHGTSIRIGNTIVKRKLNPVESIFSKLKIKIVDTEYDYVFGSRKVVKDINNPKHNHFYGEDLWTAYGKELQGILPEGFLVYGELIGWTLSGAPIQKDYTYDLPEGKAKLYVYRVATINPQGRVTDLSWDQVVEFCKDFNLSHVPELWRGLHKDFKPENYLDKQFYTKYPQAIPLSNDKTVDEGVCIRIDGLAPYILKSKSPIFFEYETKLLDEEIVDIESQESV